MRRPAGKKQLDPEKAVDAKSAHAFAIAYLARRDFSAADLRRKLKDAALPNRPSSRSSRSSRPATSSTTAATATTSLRIAPAAGRVRRASARSSNVRAGSEAIQTTMDKAKDDGPDFVASPGPPGPANSGPEIPKDWKERSRQARFLQYRGFSTDHIRAVLEGVPDDRVRRRSRRRTRSDLKP